MMEWLTLITGAVVAVATAVLAYITWQHVRLTRETLKATYKPEIIIRLLRGNLYVHNEYFADYEIIKMLGGSVNPEIRTSFRQPADAIPTRMKDNRLL